jgi:hypothetical protein
MKQVLVPLGELGAEKIQVLGPLLGRKLGRSLLSAWMAVGCGQSQDRMSEGKESDEDGTGETGPATGWMDHENLFSVFGYFEKVP